MARTRVTIADIAREAGVSVPTVSKVLNGRHEVAPDTRDRIERLIEKHRYARRPRRQDSRAGLVDLVFPELDSAWDVEIIRGVEEIAHQAKMGTVVSAIHGHGATARNWLDNLSTRRSDGVILAVSDLTQQQADRIRSLGTPIVAIDPTGGTPQDIPSVGATNWTGALTATEHLISLGHQEIAFVGGPDLLQCSRARGDGFRSAMHAAGLTVRPELVHAGDFSHEAGQRVMERLLALPAPPTAVFAGNDQQALGACQAVRDHGLRIPDDVSVIGFDDLPAARWTNPPLTTIRQPIAEMAAQAMRMLLRYLDTGEYGTQRVELSTELVVRASTAAPRDQPRRRQR
ncbi:MAG TPA: LacI family DNA-binding transcriptional regulator [Pseudonocardiaceae bacterium]|nr:LacI family DNA-binding transcriptional regulator [Pseudonocardiaceae bacterium]